LSAKRRVFFALWPDADAGNALASLAAAVAKARGGRETRPDQLHVTVAFVGAVAPAATERVLAAGARAAVVAAPFELVLDRLGGAARDGVAWVEASSPPPGLTALHEALAGALRDEGFPLEARAFRPHVTLARRCTRPADRREVAPLSWVADRLALVVSTSAPGGSRYQTVAAWPLLRPEAGAAEPSGN
jgi:2'-5' RNA ligase